MTGGHLPEGAHQSRQVLARLGGPDGEAVPPARRGQQPAERAGDLGARDRWEIRDAGRHDPHVGGIGPERLDDLAGDERRVGVDPRAAPEGAADQPGIGQGRRVAQLGMMERGEVVHRDDGRGVAGGRNHEVRAVHHVGAADEPLHRRDVGAPPQRVQRPGRHGPLVHGDTRRKKGLDQVAPAPAHGVCPDVDARALRQRRELPRQKAPMPVGRPSSGVASSATRRRVGSAPRDGSRRLRS